MPSARNQVKYNGTTLFLFWSHRVTSLRTFWRLNKISCVPNRVLKRFTKHVTGADKTLLSEQAPYCSPKMLPISQTNFRRKEALPAKSQSPLIRFVADLLYNKLYNKSTTNPQQIESCTTNPQHLDMSRCCTMNRKPPASPQQIHNKSKQWSSATTCCGFAVALQPITEEN